MTSAEAMRRTLCAAAPERRAIELRGALAALPADARDEWVDDVLDVDEVLDDGPDLPAGCVPYLPTSVDVIVSALELASVDRHDVFVDVGSGVGRVTTLAHLLTGASAIGIEVQAGLVERSRALTRALDLDRVETIHGDASELIETLSTGTVFFLNCPFSGARLERVLEALRSIAAARTIRICCLHLPPLVQPWFELIGAPWPELAVYRSTAGRGTKAS
ncbi:MAG TPA: hypothetical protein VHH90_04200 [Polyangia bacterium]|nr:hypothetical protein [Polyangia bacterium]HVZ73872.1 hypothetical protein [Polyangia bacterium]